MPVTEAMKIYFSYIPIWCKSKSSQKIVTIIRYCKIFSVALNGRHAGFSGMFLCNFLYQHKWIIISCSLVDSRCILSSHINSVHTYFSHALFSKFRMEASYLGVLIYIYPMFALCDPWTVHRNGHRMFNFK